MDVCPKCGKPSWSPVRWSVTNKKSKKTFTYLVYRHPVKDRRRKQKIIKHYVPV